MKTLPVSQVISGHIDFPLLSGLAGEIIRLAGGESELRSWFPKMLRSAVDDVVDTANTRRRSYGELEKTEKTYLGTRVEILVRGKLRLPKGRLDFLVAGRDVDMKFTITGNWMIPSEALGHVCLVAALDEQNSRCHLGIFVARPEYLTGGVNRDGKKSVSSFGFSQILWLLKNEPVEENFWRSIPAELVDEVFNAATGNDRIVSLFRGVLDRPVGRRVVEEAAAQKDFMRRLRADKSRGTRGRLLAEGIVLLNGTYDAALISDLGLPHCGQSEFISHRVQSHEVAVCARHGWNVAAFDVAP
ncbi:NaeI family type II restriction endonuclease [Falsigemmobacter intermedius]|uniref:Type II restriction enzyme NaeI domain-containing protein n=1 Tax=Falsigemmobacter intermedius TaxID=1553448 RepID=A0A444MF96_9RHOB|nr:NaeI family type II restriction endonuclease [Falsigemmobacter intermedius]RWY43649.1 hypothetical protein EP867_04405 [Falsigemmobacter intermedius]